MNIKITNCGDKVKLSQVIPIQEALFKQYMLAPVEKKKTIGTVVVGPSGIGKTMLHDTSLRSYLSVPPEKKLCNKTIYEVKGSVYGGNKTKRVALYTATGAASDPFSTVCPSIQISKKDLRDMPEVVHYCFHMAENSHKEHEAQFWMQIAAQALPKILESTTNETFSLVTREDVCDGLILNIEDFNRAHKLMENIYKGLMDKTISDNTLSVPPFCMFSANPTGNVSTTDFPLLSSLCVLQIEVDIEYVQKNAHKWFHKMVADFLQENGDHVFVHRQENSFEAEPCPRTWEQLSKFLNEYTLNPKLAESLPYVVNGYVGKRTGQEFLKWIVKSGTSGAIPMNTLGDNYNEIVSFVLNSEDPNATAFTLAEVYLRDYAVTDKVELFPNMVNVCVGIYEANESAGSTLMIALNRNKKTHLRERFVEFIPEVDNKFPNYLQRFLELLESVTKLEDRT